MLAINQLSNNPIQYKGRSYWKLTYGQIQDLVGLVHKVQSNQIMATDAPMQDKLQAIAKIRVNRIEAMQWVLSTDGGLSWLQWQMQLAGDDSLEFKLQEQLPDEDLMKILYWGLSLNFDDVKKKLSQEQKIEEN